MISPISSLPRIVPAVAFLVIFSLCGNATARHFGHGSVHRSVNVHANRNVHVNTYRHVDVDVHHHGYGYGGVGFGVGMFTGLVIGTAIAAPPPAYTTVVVSGSNYLYADGVYYQPASSGYVVVGAPIGATVAAVPPERCLLSWEQQPIITSMVLTMCSREPPFR